LQWVADHQNDDGGWGDTVKSKSNVSTTALCWAALGISDTFDTVVRKAEQWLTTRAGGLKPEKLIPAIERRYGEDRTFSVPILTMCALAGRLGKEGLQHVRPLPFELAVLPHWTYRWLKLDVVSYALPALIAMGQARHHAVPSRHPVARFVRNLSKQATLRRLVAIQPASGGFLEAAPLTSFVVMSIATFLPDHHPVIRRGTEFLVRSVASDGSWPIDTNLATWLGRLDQHLTSVEREEILEWLLGQQYREVHPYTGAAPGGWAWTDLTGGVPDADDTSGALIALAKLVSPNPEMIAAAELGVGWLLDLQNRDGGIPTFCRGWGRFPFDRSSTDITAHALRAWKAWLPYVSEPLRRRVEKGRAAAYGFLKDRQRDDGSWLPLWFGNQHSRDEENPTYGTTRVVTALNDSGFCDDQPCNTGLRWLLRAQSAEGSWSGQPGLPPSIEETALAVEALASADHRHPRVAEALKKGVQSLIDQTDGGTRFPPVPIGFYFARLWYYEELYPVIFAAAALERASRWLASQAIGAS
jgi:squalene-hopene/tetraprenyl-beta-curcumene cyclase